MNVKLIPNKNNTSYRTLIYEDENFKLVRKKENYDKEVLLDLDLILMYSFNVFTSPKTQPEGLP